MTENVLELVGVTKVYPGEVDTTVLRGIDLRLGRGEMAALIGPSGSGKSTLLNILGLLDRPTAGELFIEGKRTADLDDTELTRIRGRRLGFVFQSHHLLPAFTAAENVALPMAARDHGLRPEHLEQAREMLRQVGLADRVNYRPSQLSGGQQQRVAVARALVQRPALVLADEPTGNLDTQAAEEVFGLMQRFHRELGTSFLIVTHDPRLAARAERILEIVDGRIVRDQRTAA
ncbi:MAG: ABC transporter ATP-binding protein [Myxococcota bacterium]